MPSKTPRQARAMAAACRGKPRKGGIPRKVACKFFNADRLRKSLAPRPAKRRP